VVDFAAVDIAAGLGHLEPPHVANRLARARQGVVDSLLHSVRRGANDLNFLVNVFSHTPIVCRSTGQNNKNPLRPGNGAAPALIGNLLYKPTLVPAASRCAHIVCSLDVLNSCFVLRTRSGPGKKTGRSASQAGHDAAERCAKQEIYRRRFGIY